MRRVLAMAAVGAGLVAGTRPVEAGIYGCSPGNAYEAATRIETCAVTSPFGFATVSLETYVSEFSMWSRLTVTGFNYGMPGGDWELAVQPSTQPNLITYNVLPLGANPAPAHMVIPITVRTTFFGFGSAPYSMWSDFEVAASNYQGGGYPYAIVSSSGSGTQSTMLHLGPWAQSGFPTFTVDPYIVSMLDFRFNHTNAGYFSYSLYTEGELGGLQAFDDEGRDVSAYYAITTGEPTLPPVTATPEPTTMLLLGTGLAGLAAARRRRRNTGVIG